MMRGPDKQSIVVRDQNGELVVKTEELKLTKEHYPILGIPFIRGAFAFLGTMVEGVKALMYSADFYPDEDESSEPSKFEQWLEGHVPSKTLDKLIVAFATIVAVAFSVGLFFLLPTVVDKSYQTGCAHECAGAECGGGHHPYRHLPGLPDFDLKNEGHPPGVFLPWRGA